MKKPFWVLEKIDAADCRRLFTFWSVEFLATRYAWLSLFSFSIAGLAMAALLADLSSTPVMVLSGLVYGLFIYSTNIVHTLGHILSGHLVGHPMQANLLTATFDVNLYLGDQSGYARLVHLGRAIGGPLLNLFVGLISLIVGRWTGWSWPVILGFLHLASGIWTLFPIAPMDGWVVLRQFNNAKESLL